MVPSGLYVMISIRDFKSNSILQDHPCLISQFCEIKLGLKFISMYQSHIRTYPNEIF